MKKCDYGCDNEAKFFLKSVKKWCCSSHYKKCSYQRSLMEGKNNPFHGKKHTNKFRQDHSKRMSIIMKDPKKNPMKNPNISKKHRGKKLSEEHKEKIRQSQAGKNNSMYGRLRTISYIKGKHPIFYKEEEMKYDYVDLKNNLKIIQVHCKNSKCINSKEKGGWFIPTGRQLESRIYAIEKGNGGCYLYCSEKCKQECLLYNLKVNAFINFLNPQEEYYSQSELQIFNEEVLKRANDLCEYCGNAAECVHHIKPKKIEPFFALDPDYGIACCKKCHYEKGHSKGTECSTGNLANKICNKEKTEKW